ncbi:MAG TPA: hypothetical protein VHH88_00005, partial [Verrucomicrobiae bacterium]|nr:hypothetical protein [Verrucomicrobiae bacterium]
MVRGIMPELDREIEALLKKSDDLRGRAWELNEEAHAINLRVFGLRAKMASVSAFDDISKRGQIAHALHRLSLSARS